MTLPTIPDLLQQLDRMGHLARTSRMFQLGRERAGTAGLAALVAHLSQGDVYQKRLAMAASAGAGDAAAVLAGLRAPSI